MPTSKFLNTWKKCCAKTCASERTVAVTQLFILTNLGMKRSGGRALNPESPNSLTRVGVVELEHRRIILLSPASHTPGMQQLRQG